MTMTNMSHFQDVARLKNLVINLSERIRILESEAPSSLEAKLMNSGDIAWLLTATALVFFMTIPGLTLYYAGMATQKTNIVTLAMQSFTICCLITVVWVLFGYSLSFGTASRYPVIGDSSRFFLVNFHTDIGHELAPTIPEQLFCVYQLGFAVVTACILCGASADRMKFISMITFVALWHVLVYCPVAYSNWNQSGFLHSVGVLDWAGGNVVHVAAGMSGLVTSLVIGKRRGYGKQPFTPINMLHTIAGACFLWVGWFGFNGGSSFRADEGASRALFMTQVATSAAAFSWILMERVTTNRPTVLGMLNGAVAGLVAITPSAGYVDSTGAFFIGLISGPVCYYGTTVKKKLGLDDALDAFGLHGIAGFYGVLMTGLFANSGGATGAFYGNSRQLALQLYGVICTVAWSLSVTYVILIAVNVTMGLRVSVTAEESGLDRSSHGEGLYVERSKVSSTAEQLAQLIESCAAAVHKPTVSSRDIRAVGGEGAGGMGVALRVGIGEGGGGGEKAGGGVGKGGSGGGGGGVVGEKEGGGGGGDGGSVGMGVKEMEWVGGIDEIPHTARRKPFPREKRRAEDSSTSTKRVTLLPIPRTRSNNHMNSQTT